MSRKNGIRINVSGKFIGNKAEKLAESALEELQTEKKIRGFYKYDHNGVDYIVKTYKLSEVKFQIKSSAFRVSEHCFKYPEIPVIFIRCYVNMTTEEVKTAIRRAKKVILETVNHFDSYDVK